MIWPGGGSSAGLEQNGPMVRWRSQTLDVSHERLTLAVTAKCETQVDSQDGPWPVGEP
jgi:hypothetical protein